MEGEDNSLLDVLTNDDSPMADAALTQESLSNEVDRALRQLHEREREILKMFFGIGCQEMTLEEIGAKFDLTRERVRQIKEKAIRRLKGQTSRLLKSYLGSEKVRLNKVFRSWAACGSSAFYVCSGQMVLRLNII